jgi:hypothetical protein
MTNRYDLHGWAASIDRAIEAGLAYLDAERRLATWRENARVYALPSGVAEERIAESEQLLARRGLEVMLAEALEAGHRPK